MPSKTFVLRMPLEVYNQGKLEVINYAAAIRRAFPDLNNTINRVIAEDDLVVIHVTSLATMTGEFAGMPASGKQARWDAVHISRVRDGKIVEHWMVQDMLGLFQQLGFVEAPPMAAPAG